MTDTKTSTQQARAAGAKTPADRKKAASATVKALQAEAADGDRVIEFKGEIFTLRLAALQEAVTEDYEFLERTTTGNVESVVQTVQVVLSDEDQSRLKDLVRNKDTGKVKTEVYLGAFNELMEAAGQGN